MAILKTRCRLVAFLLFISVQVHPFSAQATPFANITLSRQAVDGDGHGGAGYTVLPVLQDETPAVAIVIHGLGGTGEEWGFISLALAFFSLNYVKFVVPSAPVARVSYLREQMPSWFDITSFTRTSSVVDREQLLGNVDRIHSIIRGEIDNGVSSERIFVVGFSQGGALALTAFLRSPWTLGGCVGVATWLPLDNEYPQERSNSIIDKDILLLHGSDDIVVLPRYAEQSRNRLQAINQNVNLTFLPDQPHLLLNTDVIRAIETFISSRAKGTTQYLKSLVIDLTSTFSGLTSQLDSMPRR